MFTWLRNKLKRFRAKEEADLGFGSIPDPGLAANTVFRQWLGIYQVMDRASRERGGQVAERPADERMLYIARGLMRYNSYAQGFINSLRTHVLGANGLVHQFVGPSAKVANAWLKKWKDEVDWWSRERELYERVHIEGEAVPRFFLSEGSVELRMIEPEWIVAPDGSKEWTFGFYNVPDDVETVTSLWALYGDGAGEEVDWTEWYHIKSKLTVRAEKRGRSDFLATAALLDDSFKTWRNFIRSEAVRQAIIYFAEQPVGVTAQDIDQATAADADYTPPEGPTGRRTSPTSLVEGSAVEYLPNGVKLQGAPPAENIQGTMTGVNAALLAVGRPYNMPLVLISGDMSANNTLDFGDESPFGTAIGDEQSWYCKHVRNILWRVLETAAEDSEVLAEALEDGTDLKVTSERKPARDAEKNTARAKTLYDDGIISKRERATMEGVDYDEQQAQILREHAGVEAVDSAGVALNGAQISSLLEIIDRLAQKQYPPDATANVIKTAFPALASETIKAIVTSIASAKPPQPDPLQALEEAGELVERTITVHRGGKTFQEKRKVRLSKRGKRQTTGNRVKLEAVADEVHRSAIQKALAKFKEVPQPTREEVRKAKIGIAKLGANKFRKGLVGNSTDRAKRRAALLNEFGDGKTCPCIYCGLKIGEGTLEQDKILTTAQGGRYRTANLVPACSSCNKVRGDTPFEEVAKELQKHATPG